jgi:hypothetical protein
MSHLNSPESKEGLITVAGKYLTKTILAPAIPLSFGLVIGAKLRVSDARPQPSHSGAGLATILAVLLLVTRHTPPAPSLAQLA